jgi:1-deoxy-D-xylulose-5-phosphate synthase
MLKTAISCGRPASLRYPRGNGWCGFLDEEAKEIPIGKAEVIRQGKDLILLAVGSTVKAAMEAASRLQNWEIDSTVVNARFVKPLDEELILSLVSKCRRLITVEENALQGGFGSAVLELLEEKGVTGVEVKRLGIPDNFVEHGAQDSLRNKYGIDAEGIVRAGEELLKVRSSEFRVRS